MDGANSLAPQPHLRQSAKVDEWLIPMSINSRNALKAGALEVSKVVDNAFFTFCDPDGNLLMVADVPSASNA